MFRVVGFALGAAASAHGVAWAQALSEDQAAVLRGELALLQEAVLAAEAENDREIAALEARTQEQARLIEQLSAQVAALAASAGEPSAETAPVAAAASRPEPRPARRAPAPQDTAPQDTAPQVASADGVEVVGERPPEETTQPRVQLFADVGGILTPKGQVIFEPSVDYATTSDNRFFFSGAEIVDTFLIGLLEARDTQRTSVTVTPQLRYGVTGRFEVDVSLPYVYRSDTRRGDDVSVSGGADGPSFVRDLEGSGLGDLSLGLHYQLNQGRRWPYVVANLRTKAPTGRGPLDADFDENGNPTEAATGSGYWTIEPSVSFIKQLDPVALFANLGYQFNLREDLDTVIGEATYDSVDPGDAIRTSMGLGIGLNERVNVSFGYDQSYVFASEARVIDEEAALRVIRGRETTVGSFLFGVNTTVTDKLNLGFNASIGATDEAPDVNLRFRARYAY